MKQTRDEILASEFSQALGDNYDIKANDNNFKSWDYIIVDDMIHGVIRNSGGQSSSVDDSIMKTITMTISIAVPSGDINSFNKEIENIEETFTKFNHQVIQCNAEKVYLIYNNITPAQKTVAKGNEYGEVNCFITAIVYYGITLAKIGIVNIDGEDLKGLFNATYDCSQQQRGVVVKGQPQTSVLLSHSKILSCDVLFNEDDELHKDLMQNEDTGKKYTIIYDNGIVKRTMDMVIVKFTEQAIIGDAIKGNIQFTIGR